MKPNFPIEKTVHMRHSVRTYNNQPLTEEEKVKLETYIANLTNPFSIDVSFQILDKSASNKGEKVGTYGVIKGVTTFIGASVPNVNLSLEALGAMEKNLSGKFKKQELPASKNTDQLEYLYSWIMTEPS